MPIAIRDQDILELVLVMGKTASSIAEVGQNFVLSIPYLPVIRHPLPCVARNHQIFVGRNDPRGGSAAGHRDSGAAGGVC
jgi:hypothetical protein